MNEEERLVTKLFACCDFSDYPDGAILIDTIKISDLLETLFIQKGLLDGNKCWNSSI